MNARQVKKKLKQQIRNLEYDNKLMKDIIYKSPDKTNLYNLYTSPLTVYKYDIPVHEYRMYRQINYSEINQEEILEITKRMLADDMAEEIKKYIAYSIEEDYESYARLVASIFIGRKEN